MKTQSIEKMVDAEQFGKDLLTYFNACATTEELRKQAKRGDSYARLILDRRSALSLYKFDEYSKLKAFERYQ